MLYIRIITSRARNCIEKCILGYLRKFLSTKEYLKKTAWNHRAEGHLTHQDKLASILETFFSSGDDCNWLAPRMRTALLRISSTTDQHVSLVCEVRI
jgi:hypothetical protein